MKRKAQFVNCKAIVHPDAKVQMLGGRLEGSQDNFNTHIKLLNFEESSIMIIKYSLDFYNSLDEKINNDPHKVTVEPVNIQTGQVYTLPEENISDIYPSAKYFIITLDSATLNTNETRDLKGMEGYEVELESFEDREINVLKELEGEDCRTFSREFDQVYRCVCGVHNHIEVSKCIRCQRDKEEVLEKFGSFDNVQILIDSSMGDAVSNIREDLLSLDDELPDDDLPFIRNQKRNKNKSEKKNGEVLLGEYYRKGINKNILILLAAGILLVSAVVVWILK